MKVLSQPTPIKDSFETHRSAAKIFMIIHYYKSVNIEINLNAFKRISYQTSSAEHLELNTGSEHLGLDILYLAYRQSG